jgi:catechol 2,3-dioxygenase-like lactoylglutathione lyase family enzyme
MAIEITEINHVNITVPRSAEAAAKHFYGAVLGLEEIPKPEESRGRGGAWYELGAVQLHLSVEDSPSDNQSTKRHVCDMVRDLASAEKHLRNSSVEIVSDDRPVRGWARFYIHDPGGNRIEIAQDPSTDK